MATTMEMIAEQSGYCAATVSNVLNGKSRVSPATKTDIMQIAARLGYQHQPPVPLPNLTETDKAWLAGITDGEGCLHIGRFMPNGHSTHRSIQYRPLIHIRMGHKPTIDKIASLFGFGSGHIEVLSKNPKWNDCYAWQASSRQAVIAVQIIRPYLVTKAGEADVILEFGQLPNGRPGRGGLPLELVAQREALYHRLSALKPRNKTQYALSEPTANSRRPH